MLGIGYSVLRRSDWKTSIVLSFSYWDVFLFRSSNCLFRSRDDTELHYGWSCNACVLVPVLFGICVRRALFLPVSVFILTIMNSIAFSPLIVSYTVEILPFHLRAKGFTVFNFTISLALIFNQVDIVPTLTICHSSIN
jgi:hypothetical protein